MNTDYKIIGKAGNELHSDVALHPGEVVEMELLARGIKKIDFASLLAIKPGHLSELLVGKRHLSALMALKLEKLLGIDAEFWLRVQSGYDLERVRKKFMKPISRMKRLNKRLTSSGVR